VVPPPAQGCIFTQHRASAPVLNQV